MTSAMTLMDRAAFMVTIASRALGWPVHVAFITAHEGTGTGLGGGRGEGVSLGSGLGEGVGVGLATSEGLGLGGTAVGALPHAASTTKAASAPTPSLTEEYNGYLRSALRTQMGTCQVPSHRTARAHNSARLYKGCEYLTIPPST